MASTASQKHPLLLASAVANGILALAHTQKGLDQFKHTSMRAVPKMLRGAITTGWYEGSGFFLILGILNYKWSQSGIYDIYDKGIAGVYVTLLFGAGASYYKSGDKLTAVVLAAVAILQGLGVRNGSYSKIMKK